MNFILRLLFIRIQWLYAIQIQSDATKNATIFKITFLCLIVVIVFIITI